MFFHLISLQFFLMSDEEKKRNDYFTLITSLSLRQTIDSQARIQNACMNSFLSSVEQIPYLG